MRRRLYENLTICGLVMAGAKPWVHSGLIWGASKPISWAWDPQINGKCIFVRGRFLGRVSPEATTAARQQQNCIQQFPETGTDYHPNSKGNHPLRLPSLCGQAKQRVERRTPGPPAGGSLGTAILGRDAILVANHGQRLRVIP